MVKGYCRTNLDNYDCSLVTVFASVPLKGDLIPCLERGKPRLLKVVGITHSQTEDNGYKEPFIIVELHSIVEPIKNLPDSFLN